MRKFLYACLLAILAICGQLTWSDAAYAADAANAPMQHTSPASKDRDDITAAKPRYPNAYLKNKKSHSPRKKFIYELRLILSSRSPIVFQLKATEPDEHALQVFPNTGYDILAPTGSIGTLEIRYQSDPERVIDNSDNLTLFSGDTIKVGNTAGKTDYYVISILHTDMMAAFRLRERWLYGMRGLPSAVQKDYHPMRRYNDTRHGPATNTLNNDNDAGTSNTNPGAPSAERQTNPRLEDECPKPNIQGNKPK